MISLVQAIASLLTTAPDTVKLDLFQPVSPLRVPGEFVAKIRNIPQSWSVQTKYRFAPTPEIPLKLLPVLGEPDPEVSQGGKPTGLVGLKIQTLLGQGPKCQEFDPSGDLQSVYASARVTSETCKTDPAKLKPAEKFLKDFRSMTATRDSIWNALLAAKTPGDISKLTQIAEGMISPYKEWEKVFQPVVASLLADMENSTSRVFSISLNWNDSAEIRAGASASTKGDTLKSVSILLIHARKTPSMKGVSVGLGWYSHPVNNFTVIHSTDTTRKVTQSVIQNNREDLGGSIQPSLVIFLPVIDLDASELGFTLGLSPKIDLSNLRIFDASFSAGLAWASHPFGVHLSAGMTPLAHLKGDYQCNKLYDGDLDAGSVTQNTFNLMVGAGVFWKAF